MGPVIARISRGCWFNWRSAVEAGLELEVSCCTDIYTHQCLWDETAVEVGSGLLRDVVEFVDDQLDEEITVPGWKLDI